jgi:hypothetical protein
MSFLNRLYKKNPVRPINHERGRGLELLSEALREADPPRGRGDLVRVCEFAIELGKALSPPDNTLKSSSGAVLLTS